MRSTASPRVTASLKSPSQREIGKSETAGVVPRRGIAEIVPTQAERQMKPGVHLPFVLKEGAHCVHLRSNFKEFGVARERIIHSVTAREDVVLHEVQPVLVSEGRAVVYEGIQVQVAGPKEGATEF